MNDQRFFDLAVKVIARQATTEERAELDAAVAGDQRLKEEFERLRASARVAKEALPLVDAMESKAGELPAYARQRLQTKVRETLGGPQPAPRKLHWGWRWFLVLGPATALVIFLLVMLTQPKAPLIQVAMLDTAGTTRGTASNEVALLEESWKRAPVQSFETVETLAVWEKSWPADGTRPVAKVIYDRTAAEVRVLGRWNGKSFEKTFPVDQGLATSLKEADAFIRGAMKR